MTVLIQKHVYSIIALQVRKTHGIQVFLFNSTISLLKKQNIISFKIFLVFSKCVEHRPEIFSSGFFTQFKPSPGQNT